MCTKSKKEKKISHVPRLARRELARLSSAAACVPFHIIRENTIRNLLSTVTVTVTCRVRVRYAKCLPALLSLLLILHSPGCLDEGVVRG